MIGHSGYCHTGTAFCSCKKVIATVRERHNWT
uniref:Uncharacterized protein n=1 Tax=Arundo donax TaxID=35708 RepID=A0A0A9CKV9_ARUDO